MVATPPRNATEFKALLAELPTFDQAASAAAYDRQAQLTKPAGSLGRLEDTACFLAGWQGGAPKLDHVQALVFAGNHGVAARGVSAFPPAVTAQMVENFKRGGAAINQLCGAAGATLSVIPLMLERPTVDFTTGPAMTDAECAEAFAAGMQAVDATANLLIVGEMGIGNTTVASAIATAVLGGDDVRWIGAGTGVDDAGRERKIAVIETALALHRDHLAYPWEIMRRLGGRELAAMAGAMLAARLYRIPVLLDGFVCTAALLPLWKQNHRIADHCLAGHCSAEHAHGAMLAAIGKTALLNLGMRLGEGSGAAVALLLLRAAVACHNGMATFAEAMVDQRK